MRRLPCQGACVSSLAKVHVSASLPRCMRPLLRCACHPSKGVCVCLCQLCVHHPSRCVRMFVSALRASPIKMGVSVFQGTCASPSKVRACITSHTQQEPEHLGLCRGGTAQKGHNWAEGALGWRGTVQKGVIGQKGHKPASTSGHTYLHDRARRVQARCAALVLIYMQLVHHRVNGKALPKQVLQLPEVAGPVGHRTVPVGGVSTGGTNSSPEMWKLGGCVCASAKRGSMLWACAQAGLCIRVCTLGIWLRSPLQASCSNANVSMACKH